MNIPPGEYAVHSLEMAIDDLSHLYATDPEAVAQIEADAARVFECQRRLGNLAEELRPVLAKQMGAAA